MSESTSNNTFQSVLKSDYFFYIQWVFAGLIAASLAGVFGPALGEGVGFSAGYALHNMLGLAAEWRNLFGSSIAGCFNGAISGIIVGLLEFFVVRQRFSKAILWIPLTTLSNFVITTLHSLVGALIDLAIGRGGSLFCVAPLLSPFMGALMGGLQYLVLSRSSSQAKWWILMYVILNPLDTLLFLLSFFVLAVLGLPVGNPLFNFLLGGFFGLFASAITGLMLVWISRAPKQI
jgi:hypothetical protein